MYEPEAPNIISFQGNTGQPEEHKQDESMYQAGSEEHLTAL